MRRALLAAGVVAISMAPGHAAEIFVTSTDDGIAADGDCTLREAIKAANLNVAVDTCAAGGAAPAIDVVVLTETAVPYRLDHSGSGDELGDLDVYSAVEIAGAPSTIDATGLGDRIFDVRAGGVLTLVLTDLRGGDAGPNRGGAIRAADGSRVSLFRSSVRGGHAGMGAGIALLGGAAATLHDSEVSHNGGVHAIHVSSGTLRLVDSTVAGNVGAGVTAAASLITLERSTIAGNSDSGLHAAGVSNVEVRNSTVSGNGALHVSRGGGLKIESPALASLYYSTVTDNDAATGGGVHVTGTLTMKGSILGANHASGSHPDCYSEAAVVATQGWNLLHRDDCAFAPVATDRVGAAPALDVLGDWGGPTRTHRLLPGSPALDGADPGEFPAKDQRGEPRPRHGDLIGSALPDIGAHENGTTIVVDAGTDDGTLDGRCSLREAIRAANTDTAVDGCRAGFERDLIWIDPAIAGEARVLAAGSDDQSLVGDLDVRYDVDVAGLPERRATVDGNGVDRVFEVFAPALLGLSHLVVENGSGFLLAGGGLRVGAGAAAALRDVEVRSSTAVSQPGGGAYVQGELVGEEVWFRNNSATGDGGGIAVDGAAARLRLVRAKVTGNQSQDDGGGVAIGQGRAQLHETTIADNRAADDGGGIFSLGAVELRGVTVAFNRADADSAAGGDGGGIHAASGARAWNSIVAENLAASSPDCAGSLESSGYNLVADATCAFAATTGDLVGLDAALGPAVLGVHSPLAGSPARDGGSPEMTGSLGSSCGALDAIGTRRPLDGDGDGEARCDIGASEAIGTEVLDVDADGTVSALTDGLLILRYLFAFRGDALMMGAIVPGAVRSDAAAVVAYLDSLGATLDADGNGSSAALTDGILILRYMFGVTGTALVQGAIGPGATRTTAAAVIAYLDAI